MAAKRKQRQTPRLDEDARDELGRGVLRGSVSRLESEPGLGDRIIERLSKGQTHATACESEGVPRRTYFGWLERGRADRDAGVESLWADFAVRVEMTIAQVLGRIEQMLLDCERMEDGRIDPSFAKLMQFLAERRMGEQYGRRIEYSLRMDAATFIIEQMDEWVRAGQLSPSARMEMLMCFRSMSGDEASVH